MSRVPVGTPHDYRHSHAARGVVAMAVGIVSLSSAVMLVQLLYACYAPMVVWMLLGVYR